MWEAVISLSTGDRLGPYQILAQIGGGGMGEVYRAHDSRLSRDVALKVMRSSLPVTADGVAQFSREARAAGSLNHPNIVTVFDVGTEEGAPYVVTELLEGESLRERLAGGPLPFRKAIDYGIQMADALGAAHEKGIIHRDVKPENAFVTREGRIKLLDFGLAKLRETDSSGGPEDTTADEATSSGLRGTASYMSPEQVLCGPIDVRTDLFSLGAVLYEMFTGTQAFHRASRVETLNAVLKEDAADSLNLAVRLPRPAVIAVRRCLEKGREERFQSARDLSFHLQQVRDRLAEPPPPPPRGLVLARRLLIAALVMGTVAAVATVLLAAWRQPVQPRLDRLTFSRGRITGARFRTDREVVYSLRAGDPSRVFSVGLESVDPPENLNARWLEVLESSDLLAVRGETYALSLERRPGKSERFMGRLAWASGGGAPRDSGVEVEDADLDPTGQHVVAACTSGIVGASWLEYPVAQGAEGPSGRDAGANKVYEPLRGSVASPRFSPDGRRIAFVEDPSGVGRGGRVMVLDLASRRIEPLTEKAWPSLRGVAWARDGREVWFTAGDRKDNRALRAVTLKRQERLVYQAPNALTLWDIGPDGRVLLSQDEERKVIVGMPAGETAPRDLSLHDLSGVADLSTDGEWILFSDRGGLFVRHVVSPTKLVHLVPSGFADALSPDGRSILVTDEASAQLKVLKRDVAAEPRVLRNPFEVSYNGASWFPDGQRVLLNGATKGLRAYVYDLRDDSMRVLTPVGIRGMTVSPDGRRIATTGGTDGVGIRDATAGADEPSVRVKGSLDGDRPVGWTTDGQWLWLFRRGEMPAKVYRLNVVSGERVLWNTLVPPDPAGVYALTEFHVTPKGDAYVYSYVRVLSQLYVAGGLK